MINQAQLDRLCINTIRTLSIDAIQKAQSGHPGTPMGAAPTVYCLWQRFLRYDPEDANEVVAAWRVIMRVKDRPVSLVLTRQALATLDRTKYAPASGVSRGAYVLADAPDGRPDVLLLATGSEVSLCIRAYEQLKSEGIRTRVISMPSWKLFESQSQEYRDSVIPPEIAARVAVEEASTFGWERYTGLQGTVLGLHTFGLSAPMKVVAQHFGFEPEHVVTAAKEQIARHASKK
jgi:transketolase